MENHERKPEGTGGRGTARRTTDRLWKKTNRDLKKALRGKKLTRKRKGPWPGKKNEPTATGKSRRANRKCFLLREGPRRKPGQPKNVAEIEKISCDEQKK